MVGMLAYSLHTMVNVGGQPGGDPPGGDVVPPLGMSRDLVQVIALMLQVEARYQDQGVDSSLEILVTQLCFRGGALEALVEGLCFDAEGVDGVASPRSRFNSNHVYLFDALVAGVASSGPTPSLDLPDSRALAYLHRLLAVAMETTTPEAGGDGSVSTTPTPTPTPPTTTPAAADMVARSCLHLWRDAMANSRALCPETVSVVASAFPTLLDMLRRNVYVADVLSVIANACHRRPEVQACLLGLGTKGTVPSVASEVPPTPTDTTMHDTLCLILSHARGNPDAPLAREWALLAVRNLCECSQDARDAIQALERVGGDTGNHQGNHQGNHEGPPTRSTQPKQTYEVEYDANAGGWKLGLSSSRS